MSVNESLGSYGGTKCLSKAGLAIGSTASQIAIAAPNGAGVDFCIDGLMYHKADAASVAITAAAVVADDSSCLFLVCLNSSGTLSTVKGTAVLTANLTGGDAVLDWPAPAAGTCPIGAFKMVTDGGTFTAGTTDLDGTGCTATYYDFYQIPPQPLTA